MKIRRKTLRCLNCNHTLGEIYNFCPRCGQENNDHNVSFGTFIRDFFSNYFSFDTRIGRSLQPLFFRPGFLTNQFNQGKRMRYVHPLRLYLIVSVLFFFVATLLVQQSLEDVSLTSDEADTSAAASDSASVTTNGWNTFVSVMRDATLSDQEALDSLRRSNFEINLGGNASGSGSVLGRKIFHQFRKVASNDLSVFGGYIIQNLPVMMFIVLPLLALAFKLFYIRRQPLYVHHLVHVLHLHAFAFLVCDIYLLMILTFGLTNAVPDWANNIIVFLLVIYSFLSFLQVYQQSWYKTLFKFLLLGNVYIILLMFAFVLEGLISLLIF